MTNCEPPFHSERRLISLSYFTINQMQRYIIPKIFNHVSKQVV